MSEFFVRNGATDTPSVARVDANGMQYVKPTLASAGHVSTNTNASGSGWSAFASTPCVQLTISNDTGTDIEVRQDAGSNLLTIFNGTYYTLYGLSDTSQITVRRKDQSVTQVLVKARWEA